MAVSVIDVIKFPKYEIHFIRIQSVFLPPGFVSEFSGFLTQSLNFNFSGNPYHKLFKIKKFHNLLPALTGSPTGVGDENGFYYANNVGSGSIIVQPLFDNYRDWTTNPVNVVQYASYVNTSGFEIDFSFFGFSGTAWNNKQSNPYYPFYDFSANIQIRETFVYRSLSYGGRNFVYNFTLGLYFAYENDPELLLYI